MRTRPESCSIMCTNTDRSVGKQSREVGDQTETGGFAMLEALAADTRVITYLMAGLGILGILAKIINQFTLTRLVRAAGNMPKSTHRLIKLVRAKYEHACLIHDSVENIDAFVEKYIYEYRGFLFRVHTWRQIEVLSIWFAGIMAAFGAWLKFSFNSGFSESVYQYIAAGAAEVILLSVIMRLSDEPYKINAVKMYMVDYLENICAFRLRKQSQREKEFIDVISGEGNEKTAPSAAMNEGAEGSQSRAERERNSDLSRGGLGSRKRAYAADSGEPSEGRLPINIEGEPRNSERGEAARQAVRYAVAERNAGGVDARGGADVRGSAESRESVNAGDSVKSTGRAAYRAADGKSGREDGGHFSDDERPALREEAIRQILEEFLA